jgi:hypothetical protein
MIILFLLLVIAAIVLGVLGVVVHGLLYLLFYWRRRAHHRLLPRRPVDATPNSQEASPSVRVSAVAQAIAARAFGVTAARLPELVYLEARRLRERAGCPARGRRAPSRPLAGVARHRLTQPPDVAMTSQGSTMLEPGLPGCRTLNSEASWLSSPLVMSPLLRAASMLPPARANRAAAGTVSVRLTGLSLSLT